jgi:alpha-glucuronidase
LWDELVTRYSRGVAQVAAMQRVWATVAPSVDAERAAVVTAMLDVQRREAQWWRDASVAYWQSISKRPLPKGEASPLETLNAYKRRSFPYAPGN